MNYAEFNAFITDIFRNTNVIHFYEDDLEMLSSLDKMPNGDMLTVSARKFNELNAEEQAAIIRLQRHSYLNVIQETNEIVPNLCVANDDHKLRKAQFICVNTSVEVSPEAKDENIHRGSLKSLSISLLRQKNAATKYIQQYMEEQVQVVRFNYVTKELETVAECPMYERMTYDNGEPWFSQVYKTRRDQVAFAWWADCFRDLEAYLTNAYRDNRCIARPVFREDGSMESRVVNNFYDVAYVPQIAMKEAAVEAQTV